MEHVIYFQEFLWKRIWLRVVLPLRFPPIKSSAQDITDKALTTESGETNTVADDGHEPARKGILVLTTFFSLGLYTLYTQFYTV